MKRLMILCALTLPSTILANNCPMCNNRGWRMVEITCQICSGRGYVDTWQGRKPCSACRSGRKMLKSTDYGTGRVKIKQSCPCRGLRLSVDDLRVICGGGTALVSGVWVSCSNAVDQIRQSLP